jgi:hypothetical protein
MTDPHPDPDRRPSRDRTLEEIFGDVLPSTTSDERDPEPPDSRDDWYEQERPPHHDRD